MADEHPYRSQPPKAFWQRSVSDRHFLDLEGLYTSKWPISGGRIATVGSCFALHVGRHLRSNGYRHLDVERPPPFLKAERWPEWGYNLYSARYGDIHTSRQLLQLLRRVLGEFRPLDTAWEMGAGFVDPFRPSIEPVPLSSVEEVEACRANHLKAVATLFERAETFIITLGSTETWVAKSDGAAFPLCPGAHGGRFDAERYVLLNLRYPDVRKDLEAFMQRARAINGRMRFLLTISPVPPIATATAEHVAVAASYSKAVLRGVAGLLAAKYSYVDYFPSLEIISSHITRGNLYECDMRGVAAAGMEHVIQEFFKQHPPPEGAAARAVEATA